VKPFRSCAPPTAGGGWTIPDDRSRAAKQRTSDLDQLIERRVIRLLAVNSKQVPAPPL